MFDLKKATFLIESAHGDFVVCFFSDTSKWYIAGPSGKTAEYKDVNKRAHISPTRAKEILEVHYKSLL